MNGDLTRPKAVGIEAKRLLRWLEENFETSGAQPLIDEMLSIVNRLAQIRRQIRKDGIVTADGRRNLMVDQELKLSAQLVKIWRTLGLADKADEERRPAGRPPESERRWRA
jgi:hypothetical protein